MIEPRQEDTIKPWQRISEVLHAYSPAEDNRVALAHALGLALFTRSRLSLMSLCAPGEVADGPEDEPWATLKRWKNSGIAVTGPPGAELAVQHLRIAGEDPVKASITYLRENPADLVVLSTRLHSGKMSWLGKSAAQLLAGRVGQMTLLLPPAANGFISYESGAVRLDRILVAVACEPSPRPAVEAVRRIMLSVPGQTGTVTVVHAGEPAGMPKLEFPTVAGWTWNSVCRPGKPAETILGTARESGTQLIVMATAGHHGFLDAIRGTVSEHVLREAGCPLLAMPVGSFLG